MDKKAVSPEMMVVLLIFVIGAMVLYAFAGKLGGIFKEDADIETCRLSVLAQAQTRKVPVIGVDTPGTLIPLDCPRRLLKIFEDKVEIDGKKTSKYKFKKLTEEEVNHILAEELRLCWYKMGEGNRNVFEYSYLVNLKKVCLICTEVEFNDKLKSQAYDGVVDYIKSHKMPNGDVTYYDYLSKTQRDKYIGFGGFYLPWTQYTPWGHGTTNKIDESKIYGNKKYVVYFLAFKPDLLNQKLSAFTEAYYIGLGKEEKLKEECGILVN